jgi:hypothetical protein
LSALEVRKRLLIAESELNRAQLAEDWQTMSLRVCGLARRARTLGGWASAAAALLAAWNGNRTDEPAPGPARPSWFGRVLAAARLALRIWAVFRGRSGE